jgi:[ribosomal protein S18]-alanine N-acetyltransferase
MRAGPGRPVAENPSVDPDAVNLPPGTAIVTLSEAHLPQVVRLERVVFADPWPLSAFREEVARGARGGYSRVLVESELVRAYSVAWFVADEGHLANLATDPVHRGRGFARAVLRDLLAEARRREIANVWLEVRTGNDVAIHLYRAHGFRTVGIRKGYYQKEREDALVMVLPLEAEVDRGGSGQDGGGTGAEGKN